MDDIQRVDDVAKRLAHLPAMSITHNCMEIDLGAGGGKTSEAMILLSWLSPGSVPSGPTRSSLNVSEQYPPRGRGSPGPRTPEWKEPS